ncbi:DNA polymerase subunit Cdc27 [Lenzites betulinus]|nr:DNA polymerase subunit Cdc27 [Lenzites betulinus]
MSALEDYLTKQLFIQKNVVTYRSLSRQFGLHVNGAKTELAKFHEQSVDSPTRAFATYLVSGEPFRPSHPKQNGPSTQTDDGMDVDSDPSPSQNAEVEEEEEVPTITMTLVGEQNIESAKSKYARIFSTHVYCLSPSPLTDAGLICDPSAIVYEADAKDAPTSSIALGRVVGPDVRIGKAPSPVASSSKTAVEPISRKPTLKVKTEKEKADSLPAVKADSTTILSAEKDKGKASTVKAKPSGKLDWSKAKKTPEGEKGKAKEKEAEAKAKEESISPVEKAVKKTAKLELNDSPKDEGKRGVKRKAAPPPVSETEEKPVSRLKPKQPEKAAEKDKKSNTTPAPAPAPVRGEVKLRKNRIISDDEDSDAAPSPAPARKTKGKPRPSVVAADALESDAEKSLRAMMDIDDALVEKASASRPARIKPEPVDDSDVEMAPEPSEVEDVQPTQQDDDDDLVLKPKPRKRKEKKVVPVGRNGLKKKRVMKSRMTVDPKGYMVTEDYSSYESVDEDDAAEEEAPKKGKGKKAVASAAKAKKPASTDVDASEAEVPKSKPVARTSSTAKSKKPAGTKASAQGSLKDFFGKPKK